MTYLSLLILQVKPSHDSRDSHARVMRVSRLVSRLGSITLPAHPGGVWPATRASMPS